MARWIKVDGTEQEVHPASREFTNVELHTMVDGNLTCLILTPSSQGGLFMFMDDEYALKGKPVNQVATMLLHQHQPRYAHITVCGDVVVAGVDETGDE